MITPPPYYDTDQDIVNRIKIAIDNGEHNEYVFPKGCVDKHRLYDFIKGKELPRERVDEYGNRCKNNKTSCSRGCYTGIPCHYADKFCPIRSNEENIIIFIQKMLDYVPNFRLLLSRTLIVPDRKFLVQVKLLSLASECDLTHRRYTDEDIAKLDKKVLTNDFFQKTLKVQSFVLHACALAVLEPLVGDANSSVDSFIENYHMLTTLKVEGTKKKTCDPTINPGGWYGVYRAYELTQAFIKIFGSENSQLACSIVCTLSHAPGSMSSIHGGRKSPGLKTAHVIWEKSSDLSNQTISPTSVTTFGNFVKMQGVSPRPCQGGDDAPERPLKRPKEESQFHPKNLFLPNATSSFEWDSGPSPFDSILPPDDLSILPSFGMNFNDGPLEKELFDIINDFGIDDEVTFPLY